MNFFRVEQTVCAVLCCVFAVAITARAGETSAPVFERDIHPVLKANCFHCHGEEKELKGDLDLRLRRLIVKGGESGAAIAPGDRASSHLFELISSGDMPPKEKQLSAAEIELIGRWIDAGANTAAPEPEEIPEPGSLVITEAERSHWAFRPIANPAPPVLPAKDAPDIQNPIDAFVLAKLQEKGLTFGPAADKLTLIRRATFDLIGLPPTPEEVDAFLADESPDAFARVIDRLLESPHYGERWGRHWLDVAGYADSEGYNDSDLVRTDAWHYRDYVIRSMNADKPWDEFIVEQLAGDELVGAHHDTVQGLSDDPAKLEKLVATGFLRMAPDGSGSRPMNPDEARNQVITETVKIVSSSLLGMTVGCAECHHHRFDPIPQEDFYRLRAILEPVYDWKSWRNPSSRRITLQSDEEKNRAKLIEAEAKKVDVLHDTEKQRIVDLIWDREILRVPEDKREFARTAYETPAQDRTPEQVKFLTEEYPAVNVQAGRLHLFLANYEDGNKLSLLYEAYLEAAKQIRAKKPEPQYVRVADEITGKVPATHLFYRGDYNSPEEPTIAPAGLTVINTAGESRIPEDDPAIPTTGRRLAYARYLTSGRHPLTARVLVNRFWLHHFGRGLVNTPGDFGSQGQPPTHPELLDWLASDFMTRGWKLKHLHKQIMLSRTYGQSSQRRPESEHADPDNTLYWRMPVRRLEAETIRDSILAVSGSLNPTPFGDPTPVAPNPDGLFVVGGGQVSDDFREYKRSVYVQTRRSQPVVMLEVFDAPQMEPNCEQRNSSTVTTQSLALMNGEFVLGQSLDFAKRVIADTPDGNAAERVRRAWKIAFGSEPSAEEQASMETFLTEQQAQFEADASNDKKPANPAPDLQALAGLCQVLLGTNHFLYVD